jgi:hypothetical protein
MTPRTPHVRASPAMVRCRLVTVTS